MQRTASLRPRSRLPRGLLPLFTVPARATPLGARPTSRSTHFARLFPSRSPRGGAILLAILVLLGLGTPGRAEGQTCPIVESTPSTDSVSAASSDSTPERQPSQRSAPGDATLQSTSGECDTIAPAVSITPGHSTHTSSTVAVTINWGDGGGLDPGTRQVWLNGVNVTSGFSYSGSATSAQSTGTVTLVQGQNSLEAHIWDAALNHGTANATYTRAVPPPTSCPAPQFLATYYSGLALAGSPISTVCEAGVDHNWGAGSVGGTVGGDYFSARWVRRATFTEGTHRFTVTADDGVRLYVDGVLLIDRWIDQGPTTYTADRAMTAGEHEVRVEYYERGGGALVRAGWSAVLAPLAAAGTPSLHDVVRGIYRLVLERDAVPADVQYWVDHIQAGWTVKQAVRSFAASPEHYQGFLAGKPAREVVATLYRHVLAREAWPAELDYWEATAARGDWVAVVDGLMAWSGYAEWFGDHAVPGHPVALWDARRAPLVLEPQMGYADAERDLCLTVAVPGGASECGDLRLAHALPAIRSLNKVRAPVLLYNSQHARPMPVVAARVMLPVERGTPSSVQAVLLVGANTGDLTARATLNWPGSAWPVGQPRRIALTYDAWNQATGVYRYAVQVTATYPDGSVQRWMMRGSLALVNRRESTFGAGWWLAGLERLQLIEGGVPTSMLWMGGDGSTRVYEPLASAPTSVWVGRTPDRGQDTVWAVSDYPGARYMRRLPGKVRVYFDATGKHIATVNRLDHHTRFTYDTSGRLENLQVPTGGGAGGARVSYVFAYGAGGPNGRLYGVTAPDLSNRPARRVVVGPQNGDHRVWTIQDPDQKYVEFAYFDGGRPEVVSRRTDRRRVTGGAHYFFGAAGRLVKVSFDMGEMVNGQYGEADDLTTWLTPTDIIGLDGALHIPDAVHALVDGPRTDVVDATRFWLDRFGSPWRIVDAGQRETLITRGDSRFPALATRVDGPVGADGGRHIVTAEYDARGNLKSQTDWSTSRVVGGATLHATTTYERADTAWPDFVTRVTLPEGEVTRMGYHPNGNRAWQQPGDDLTRAVRFGYNVSGLVESVTHPAVGGQTAVERFEYDGFQNLLASVTPRLTRTVFRNDSLGRTWRTESPIEGTYTRIQESTFYPGNDRVQYSRTFGPAMNGVGAQTLTVLNTYDDEGNPLSVARRSDQNEAGIGWVTTQWAYDAAGRRVAEIAPDGMADSTFYDKASNVVRVRTRRYAEFLQAAGGNTAEAYITSRYDALNRVVERRVPAVRYPERRQGIATGDYATLIRQSPYPKYPNDGAGLRIAADTARFEFDIVGNMVRATNHDAVVRRSYYANGALRGDTLITRTIAEISARGDMTSHVYGLEYAYDLNGRRVRLKHPGQLAPRVSGVVYDLTTYGYDPVAGALARVSDPLGNTFRYHYDVQGRQDSLSRPGGILESYGYDADGNVTWNALFNGAPGSLPYRYPGSWIREESHQYDAAGKMVRSENRYGHRDTTSVKYSGLGHMVTSSHLYHGYQFATDQDARYVDTEQPDHDAMANVYQMTRTSTLNVSERAWLDAGSSENSTSNTLWQYQPGTGRLLVRLTKSGADSTHYDRAGNIVFTNQWAGQGATAFDRASFYDADNRLRVSETRRIESYGARTSPFYLIFEEYRYDALGRRVLVYTRKDCQREIDERACAVGSLRRTVWDGSAELYDVQVPVSSDNPDVNIFFDPSEMESDTLPVRALGRWNGYDPHPQYGRVAYTYGHSIDRPLSVIRMNYVDHPSATVGYAVWPNAFAILPHWNVSGAAQTGTFPDGQRDYCPQIAGTSRCVLVDWPEGRFPYKPVVSVPEHWHGSLLQDKRDGSGLLFRRNRYYDPSSARFTQEDPIGLAGGLNAYGFANGDPVNYSDPYGLSGCDWLRRARECMAEKFRAEAVRRGRAVTLTEARYYVAHPAMLLMVAGVVRDSELFGFRMQEEYQHMYGVDNAARHQYGQCMMTLAAGDEAAKKAGDVHEAEAAHGDQDSRADQENNARGRETASRYSRPSVRDVEANNQRHLHCEEGTRANIESGNYSWVLP